jgi:hypothetical protein
MSMHAQPSQPISEKGLAIIPVLANTRTPPSTTSTAIKTSSTGISARTSFQNTPKGNADGHLQPIAEKNPVSNSAFSANTARRSSLENYGSNAIEGRVPDDSDLKVTAGWRQFVSGKLALIYTSQTAYAGFELGDPLRDR